tara:strand:+ start:1648 stop:2631 length:984 start_codon:yes stop_codon:yes gene_type:complete
MIKTEYYLTEKVIDSNFLQDTFESFDKEKFENKIGIKERYVVSEDESSLELSIRSCKKLFESFDKSKVDFIVYCTQTPKHILPGNSSQLQHELGLESIPSFDFNLGCSGYVYGLSIAKAFIESGIANCVLLVTSDTYSKYINKKDKSNRSIFGDGSTATIIDKYLSRNIGKFILGTDGSKFQNLIIENGGGYKSSNCNPELLKYGTDNFYTKNDLYMNGIEIFNFTIQLVPDLVEKTLIKNNLEKNEIDYFIFHQANSFMLDYLRKKIKIPKEKFYNNLEFSGNTVSSTIPIAIKLSQKAEKIKKGDKVMLVGFGVGLSWGATILKI